MRNKGFTLVELSIVIVVLGLVAGGVLVGRSLIHAATLRAQIGQIDEIRIAMKTFEQQYDCIAGDCMKAVRLGLGTNETWHNGDGNGKIGSRLSRCNIGSTPMKETMNVFLHLQTAGLIKSKITFEGFTGESNIASCMQEALAKKQLAAVLGNDTLIFLADVELTHYSMETYGVHLRAAPKAMALGASNDAGSKFRPTVLIEDSYAIDTKIDDGVPITGNVGLAPTGGPWSGFIPKSTGAGGHNCVRETYVETIDRCKDSPHQHLVFLNQY